MAGNSRHALRASHGRPTPGPRAAGARPQLHTRRAGRAQTPSWATATRALRVWGASWKCSGRRWRSAAGGTAAQPGPRPSTVRWSRAHLVLRNEKSPKRNPFDHRALTAFPCGLQALAGGSSLVRRGRRVRSAGTGLQASSEYHFLCDQQAASARCPTSLHLELEVALMPGDLRTRGAWITWLRREPRLLSPSTTPKAR